MQNSRSPVRERMLRQPTIIMKMGQPHTCARLALPPLRARVRARIAARRSQAHESQASTRRRQLSVRNASLRLRALNWPQDAPGSPSRAGQDAQVAVRRARGDASCAACDGPGRDAGAHRVGGSTTPTGRACPGVRTDGAAVSAVPLGGPALHRIARNACCCSLHAWVLVEGSVPSPTEFL